MWVIHIWHECSKWPIISASFSSLDLFCFDKLCWEWTSRFWEIEEFHVWSTGGYLLGHYWNNGYNTFQKNHLDVCNLRNWSNCIFINEWTLNSVGACCYFGPHFGRWGLRVSSKWVEILTGSLGLVGLVNTHWNNGRWSLVIVNESLIMVDEMVINNSK